MSGHLRPELDQAHHDNLAMRVGPSTSRLSGIRPDQIAPCRHAKERDKEEREEDEGGKRQEKSHLEMRICER